MSHLIHRYTRAQAIEDGVLVDLKKLAEDSGYGKTGFGWDLACTSTVFERCIRVTPEAEERGEDLRGRLHDVLFGLLGAIKSGPKDTTRVTYPLVVTGERVQLVCVCGPGDDAWPVLTLMLDGED